MEAAATIKISELTLEIDRNRRKLESKTWQSLYVEDMVNVRSGNQVIVSNGKCRMDIARFPLETTKCYVLKENFETSVVFVDCSIRTKMPNPHFTRTLFS